MEFNNNLTKSNSIVNPLLKNKFEIEIDDTQVNLTLVNISRFFSKLYILTPFSNNPVDKDLYSKNISVSKWEEYKSKLVLSEASIKLIKNFDHGHNITLVNSNDISCFNHFGYDMEEKIIVLPMFNISYLNIQNYIKIYQGQYVLEDLYNVIVINNLFSKNSSNSFNSLVYITEIIKNLDETNYWTRKYNCLLNISRHYNSRKFRLSTLQTIKDKEIKTIIDGIDTDNIGKKDVDNDYLKLIFNSKNFVDASSAINKNGYKLYKISKNSDISKEHINALFSKLNSVQSFYLFSNLVISKKYCHLVLNNFEILTKLQSIIHCFSDLYRYLFGYAWLRFYMEESIKKTWTTKDDEFVFDINTASLLPVFPFTLEDIKSNPYLPIMVDDKYLQGANNIGGFPFFCTSNKDLQNQGITNLDGFRKRMNLFISGNSSHDIFNNLDWNTLGIGISGSIMAACLQERHPLVSLFKKDQDNFDVHYNRYFNEYYAEADVDVMVRSDHPLDFIKKAKTVYNQVVVNVCGYNPSNAEPKHIKINTIRTVFLFVNNQFIKDNIVTSTMSHEFIISNIKDESVIALFKPFIDKKIETFYSNLFQEYTTEEINNIKKYHPELFENNDTVYQININDNHKPVSDTSAPIDITESEFEKIVDDNVNHNNKDFQKLQDLDKKYNELGINISFKVKISSTHIQRQLELFSIFNNDFFSLVAKFHMPCVRGYYDGNNVYMTPSCISAHMTYMNLDYKYFAGSKDPIEIIMKYRMRGFGVFLNKSEIDKVLQYANKVTFWNNLYNINPNDKQTLKSCLGSLSYSHNLYHPRLFNMDLISYDAPFVNINDGYNNIQEFPMVTKNTINEYMTLIFKMGSTDEFMLKYRTIGKEGYVNPVEKWIIDAYFNINKSVFYKRGYKPSETNSSSIMHQSIDEKSNENIDITTNTGIDINELNI